MTMTSSFNHTGAEAREASDCYVEKRKVMYNNEDGT
jgi:hypothetical protein